MSSHSRASIRYKLLGAVLAAVLISTLLAAAASALRETERRFEARREALLAVAATFATALAGAVDAGDLRAIAAGLNSIRSIPRLRYAIVVDGNGRRLHEVGVGIVLGGVDERIAGNQAIGPFTALHLGTYVVSAPVVHAGRRIGQISLIADVSDLRDALLWSGVDAGAAGALAALLAVLVSLRLQSSIIRPLVRLTAAAEAIGQSGDYSIPVERVSNDEAGRLVEAFNAMMSEIGTRDAALKRHRDKLADEVAERTRDLAAAKVAAEAANAAKSDFLAIMSHEIRTPMNGMLVTAELLAAEKLGAKAGRHAEVIVRSGRTLLRLINDILDLSKIEAGHVQLESIPMSTSALVEDVVALFSERAASAGLRLEAAIDRDVPQSIVGDPLRLTQILSNLVNNALKFTEKGRVRIHVATAASDAQGCRLRFAVEDTGIGIAADRVAAVFDAFSQAEQSTTRRYGGTGIGLTICRRLVDAMHGEIVVESTPGLGSVFAFEIPVQVANAAMRADAGTPAARPEQKRSMFRGARVLAADDSALNCEVLTAALESLGLDVVTVQSGKEAIAAVEDGSFDLVFMDCSMPDMDGFEATRRIRAWERSLDKPAMPIVALTAHVIGPDSLAWREAGMTDYVAKPFTLATIADCLERCLQARDATSAPPRSDPLDETTEEPTVEHPLVDFTVLASIREMQGPGDDLVGRVLGLYRHHAPLAAEALLNAHAAAARARDLAEKAHALKSLSRNVGAVRVGNLCDQIESDAEQDTIVDRERLIAVRAAVDATLAELARALPQEAREAQATYAA